MPNIKISDLATILPGFDPDNTFVEVLTTIAGELVSRKASATEITAGAGPLAADYVTVTPNAILPNERILTGDVNIDITDGGAGSSITVSMADMPQGTVKGRADGAGTGIPIDLTASQINDILAAGGFATYFSLSATDRVIGSDAGAANTGDSVFLAMSGAGALNIADGVIAIGENALAAAVQLDFVGSIAIGRNAGALIGDTRDPWIIIGDGAAANIQPRSFHDANTIIGTGALGALGDTATVQQVTIIGHEAVSDMTGASGLGVIGNAVIVGSGAGNGSVAASISSTVIVGARACSNLTAGGVTGSVIIGNAAAEILGGAVNVVLIGANNTQNAANVDDCIILGCNTASFSVAQTANQILLGHSAFPGLFTGESNILIGNSLGITGSQLDFDGSVIIGQRAGNNMVDDQDIFAIETPQGVTSNVSRPFLFGNFLNGNLALLNIAALVGGIESGARIVPAWADAAPTAGQGVFSMYGAGTDLAATTDTDFVHLYVRSADNNMMFRFEDGSEIALNSAGFTVAGIGFIRSVGNTDAEARFLSYQHADGTQRAFTGHDNDDVFNIANEIDGGNVEISATDAASAVVTGFIFDPDALLTLRGDTGLVLETTGGPMTVGIAGTVQQTTDIDGRFFVNTLTGAFDAQGSNIVSATPDKISIFAAGSATNGVDGGNVEIWAGYAAGNAPARGGDLVLFGGGAGGSDPTGGDLLGFGGEADISPGDVIFTGGVATIQGTGGFVAIRGGAGFGANGTGGRVDMIGGAATGIRDGGDCRITSGASGGGAGADGGEIQLTGANSSSSSAGVGGAIILRAGAGAGTTGAGGFIDITGGLAPGGGVIGLGGAVTIVGGGNNGSQSAAGAASLSGGDATGANNSPGGAASLVGGVSRGTADGGAIFVTGGLGGPTDTSVGGAVNIEGGTSAATNGDGGDIVLTLGLGTGSGVEGRVIIDPALGGSAARPALAFGDGDSGFYENTDDFVRFASSGSDRLFFDTNGISGANTNAGILRNTAASATVPTFAPDRQDFDTGIGHAAGDQLSLVSGAVEGLRLTELNSGVLQVPSAAVAVTAFAGGGQGSATALIHSYNVITVVATTGDSVRLPAVFAVNSLVYVKNDDAAEAADVFPATGDDLGQGVNTAVSLPAGQSISFIATVVDSTWTPWIVDTQGGVATALLATNAAGPQIDDDAATSTNPTLIPNRADVDSGIGWTSDDRLALIAGGVLVAELFETAGVDPQLILVQNNDEARPTFAFGDGDSGFHEVVDDSINLSNGGADKLQFGVNALTCVNTATSFNLFYQAPSAVVPSFVPDRSDNNTGIGHGDTDELSLISGAIAGLRLPELNSNVIQVPDAQIALVAFATGGQGSATQVDASYAHFSTVATLNDSAKLPPVFKANSIITIKNDGAADMSLFPASGDDLGAGTDTSVQVVAGTSVQFLAISANATWTQIF